MANSPSQKWENGVMVERAIETNRHKVRPDGTAVDEGEDSSDADADGEAGSFRDKLESKPARKVTKK